MTEDKDETISQLREELRTLTIALEVPRSDSKIHRNSGGDHCGGPVTRNQLLAAKLWLAGSLFLLAFTGVGLITNSQPDHQDDWVLGLVMSMFFGVGPILVGLFQTHRPGEFRSCDRGR